MLFADDGTRVDAFRSQPGKVVTLICPSTLQLKQDQGTDIYLEAARTIASPILLYAWD